MGERGREYSWDNADTLKHGAPFEQLLVSRFVSVQ